MSQLPLTPAITPADRLGMTLFLGVVLHGLVVLGVSFGVAEPEPKDPAPNLEVTLVINPATDAPRDAERIAKANQEGAGSADKTRFSKPVRGPAPLADSGANTALPEAAAAEAQPRPRVEQVISARRSKDIVLTEPEHRQARPNEATARRRLLGYRLEISSLVEEIDRKNAAYTKRPRKKFLDAVSARQSDNIVAAAYMRAWTRKVERIGNLNYPNEASRRRLYGLLRLTVGINRDGTISEIRLDRSSGHSVLDEAAKRIVRLGAPYARLPEHIKENGKPVDILYITRTWEFSSKNQWQDRGL